MWNQRTTFILALLKFVVFNQQLMQHYVCWKCNGIFWEKDYSGQNGLGSKFISINPCSHRFSCMENLTSCPHHSFTPFSLFPFLSLQVHHHLQKSSLLGSWESSALPWCPLLWQWSLLLPVSTFFKNYKGTFHFNDGQSSKHFHNVIECAYR